MILVNLYRYVRDAADIPAISSAHGRRFADIRPANTLVMAGLVGAEHRVEIEADAEIISRVTL